MRRCRSCGQPIAWVDMADGRAHPVDPDPIEIVPGRYDFARGSSDRLVRVITDAGQIRSGVRSDSDLGREVIAAFPAVTRVTGRVSHFATCPNAAQHRKPT